MTGCKQWEERIALAAGADLDDAGWAEMESHVASCPSCAALLKELRESLDLLREVHSEPIAEARLAAVRARVMGAIDSRRWLWAAAATLACATALLAAAVWFRPARVPHPPLLAVAPPAALQPQPHRSLMVAAPVRVLARSRAATIRHRPPAPSEPVVMKLFTEDPNVVIYWIGDSQ
jgi:anti-sigma factor RsiW